MLLWEEYADNNPVASKYTSFCIKYRKFAKCQLRSMRRVHIAGEKLFVNYAGPTAPSSSPPTFHPLSIHARLASSVDFTDARFLASSVKERWARGTLTFERGGCADCFSPTVKKSRRLGQALGSLCAHTLHLHLCSAKQI